jgi:UDP-N-acetylglucosamine--N-acetylmuramyl-(pentapeptide) pyrophosphoryl-undecaprenol N-acetylglucosamine transferase
MLARCAGAITVAYASAASEFPAAKTQVTGQPIRRKVLEADREAARRRFGLNGRRKTVLVTGGSRGARSLNAATLDALPRLSRRDDLQILHLTGRAEYESVTAAAEATEQNAPLHYHICGYVDDMEQALAAADLIVCRAGSSSLAEVAALGLPAIVVPYPHAGAHQEANARPFAEAGAAIVVPDGALTGETLAELVEELLDTPRKLEAMSRAARAVARPDAADRIAEAALAIARRDP